MTFSRSGQDRAVNIVRWFARIGGVIFILATLVADAIVIAEFLGGGGPNWAALSVTQLMALIFAFGIPIIEVVGVALAWRWEGAGGVIILIAATIDFVADFVSGRVAIALTALPMALVGAAFLYCWWREQAVSPSRVA
jgi:hypothetical protein